MSLKDEFDLTDKQFEYARLRAEEPNEPYYKTYEKAGYNPGSKQSAKSGASNLNNMEKIQEAIRKLGEPKRTLGKAAVVATIEDAIDIMRKLLKDKNGDIKNPENKRKTAIAILDRAGITPEENKGKLSGSFEFTADLSPDEEEEILKDIEKLEEE